MLCAADFVQLSDQLYSGNVNQQQIAADYTRQWLEDPDIIPVLINTLEQYMDLHSNFTALLMMDHFVSMGWYNIDSETRRHIRIVLISLINTPETRDSNVVDRSSLILAKIGLCEWPEEWPTFLSDTIKLPTLSVLNEFSEEIETTRMVPVFRKNTMRSLLIQNLSEVINAILDRVTESTCSLELLNNIAKWVPLETILNDLVCLLLSDDLIQNELISGIAIKVLSTIFVDRYDIEHTITSIGTLLLSGLYKQAENNKQMAFLLAKILSMHITSFHVLAQVNNEMRNTYVKAFNLLMDSSWALENEEEYWNVWATFLRYYFIVEPNPETNYLMPLIKPLFNCLFINLPKAADENTIINEQARISIAILSNIEPDYVFDIFNTSPVSTSLCYGSAASAGCFKDSSDSLQLLYKLVEVGKTSENDEYLSALLPSVARNMKFFHKRQDIFLFFAELLAQSLESSNPERRLSAISAIKYVTSKATPLFLLNEGILMNTLVNYLESVFEFGETFSDQQLIKIYSITSSVISIIKDEETQSNFLIRAISKIWETIQLRVNNIFSLTQIEIEEFTTCFNLIIEYNNRCPLLTKLIGHDMIRYSIEIITNSDNLEQQTCDLISACYSVISSIFYHSEQWDYVQPYFESILQVSYEKLQYASYSLSFLSSARLRYPDVDAKFEEVYIHLIQPFMTDVCEETSNAFEFLMQSQYWNLGYDLPMDTLNSAIVNLPIHSLKNAFHLMIHFLAIDDIEKLNVIIATHGVSILDLILSILTDSIYNRFFMLEVRVLQHFITACIKCKIPADSMKQAIMQTLIEKIPHVEKDLLNQFFDCITANISDFENLFYSIRNLIYASHCCLPSVSNLFVMDLSPAADEDINKMPGFEEDLDLTDLACLTID